MEEPYDFLEQDTVRDLIKKNPQFINFNTHLWGSSTKTVGGPVEEDEEEVAEEEPDKEEGDDKEEKKP